MRGKFLIEYKYMSKPRYYDQRAFLRGVVFLSFLSCKNLPCISHCIFWSSVVIPEQMRAIWLTNEMSKQISSWPKPHAGHPLSSYNWFLFCQTQGARIKKTKQKNDREIPTPINRNAAFEFKQFNRIYGWSGNHNRCDEKRTLSKFLNLV